MEPKLIIGRAYAMIVRYAGRPLRKQSAGRSNSLMIARPSTAAYLSAGKVICTQSGREESLIMLTFQPSGWNSQAAAAATHHMAGPN